MELTDHQKKEIWKHGYVKIAQVIPQKMINMALRSINDSLGKRGIDPEKIPEYRASSYCPELRKASVIQDLLFETSLLKLAESATEPGKLHIWGSPQIALRFPVMQSPGQFHPHLDGMYRPGNKVLKGSVDTFTLLVGIYLSDVPNRFWGNFTVWPGTHELLEEHFREHGTAALHRGLPRIQMPEPLQITGKAGDVFLCHYQLIHTAAINVSPFIRYGVFFRLKHQDHFKNRKEVMTNIWLEWRGIRKMKL